MNKLSIYVLLLKQDYFSKIIFSLPSIKKLSILAIFLIGNLSYSYSQQTWYSYENGNWSDTSSWTLSSATNPIYLNPDGEIPTPDDNVVINPSRNITIQPTTNNITVNNIEIVGRLDLTSSTGHNFTNIEGEGTIRFSGYDPGTGNEDNFPDGTITDFVDPVNGGIVEVYGTGILLNTARSFNNLTINLSSGTATLLADYQINGDFEITGGEFRISNDEADVNTNYTPLNLIVDGDVFVESSGSISVGDGNAIDDVADNGYGNYHKYYHVFTVGGNFTNQGSVRLTNQTVPDYDSRTNTGAVSLVFNSATDKIFSCQGITDLYYLVIDKGVDQTYSLTINPTAKNYFSLFGDNDENWDNTDEENPETRKALWIKAGSLILEGYTYIPTLGEGSRDYTIGANAALVLNGVNVFVSSTTISNTLSPHRTIDYTDLSYSSASGINNGNGVQGIYVNGTLKINDGTFETNYSHGIVYREESTANKLEINGGIVTTGQFRISGTTNAANAKMSYIQTGGELNLVDNRTNAAIFDLSAGLGTFTMSAGTITLSDLSEGSINAIEISCTESNINVSGGTIIIDNSTGTNQAATISSTAPFHNLTLTQNQGNGIQLKSDITVNNNLTIEDDDFDADGYDITIGGDLSISAGATYTTGLNTTTFDGDKKSNLYIPLLQTFNNLTISKTVDDKNFIIASAPATALQIDGEFRVEKGTFDYGTYTINLNGNLYASDSIGTTLATGKIVFTSTNQQNVTSESGVIQNMQINNSYGSGSNINLNGDLNIFGTLTLTNGVFDLHTYRLTMFGSDATIAGTFGTGEMIQTDGNASDGGLGLYIDANGSYTFPIGTDDNSNTRYTPLVATYSSYTDDGYVYLSVADNDLPTTDGNGGTMLSYYWRVKHDGFTTVPKVTEYIFSGDESDEGKNPANSFSTSWRAGKVLSDNPYTRSYEDNTSISGHDLIFDGNSVPFDLENADYSAGPSNRFNGSVAIYYTANTSGTHAWATDANWDKGSVGSGTNEAPTKGSIVIIREGCRMNISTAVDTLGALTFEQALSEPTSEEVGRVQFTTAGTYYLGVVTGVGMITFNAPNAPDVTGDFGDFGTRDYSYYLYYGGNTTLDAIPTPIPNLILESATYQIDQNINTTGNLIIQGSGTIEPLQDIEIGENLYIGYWQGGTFQFPAQATAINVTVNGNIDFTQDPLGSILDRDLIVDHAGTNNVEHSLILKGDIIHGPVNGHSIDLWNTNAFERVILEIQGQSDNTYTRSSTSEPDLYRIILNKGTTQTNSFSFNESFTLSGLTNTASNKALELQNGKLILNDADIDIDLTTGEEFSLPSTAILEVTAGTINASGIDGGITLDGTLRINGGTVDMTGNASDKNFIEYGSAGSALIDISSGSLIVGSQIRRLTSSTTGILSYQQTGGDVLIGVNSDDAAYVEDRGMFEVLNTGSSFVYSDGTLTIQRQNGASPTVAALYLDPSSSDVTGSNITIGNANTPEAQNNLNINSSIPLDTLTIYAEATLTDKPNVNLSIRALTITGNLLSNVNSTFDAKGFDLTINGNYINNGTYIASGSTLIFNSETTQSLSGSGTEDIYNLTKSGSGTFTLNKESTVNNALTVNSGILNTDTYTLNVKGNAIIDGTITSTSGSGIELNGTSSQDLKRSGIGTSTIGILTINNTNGVTITLDDYNFIITNSLRLTNGVFDIGGSILELAESADIVPVNAFSLTNMIQTNSAFTDNGMKKNFAAISSSTDFTFPIGQAKYTPVVFNITSSDAGSIIIRPADEMHLTIAEDSEAPNTEITDADNCLQYHWIINAADITSLSGSATFTFDPADIEVTAPYTAINYIPARLFSSGTTWDKAFGTNAFDEGANKFTITYSNVSDENISGDYTAGVGVNNSDVAINGAIPDDVPTYETVGTGGDYDDSNSWNEAIPASGPVGAIVTVKSGATLTLNNNNVRIFRTVIETGAILEIDGTTQHRLGTVTGTGDIKIVSNTNNANLPAGYYTDFFSCSGGGLIYAGSGNYTLISNLSQVRDLTLNGTGINELGADITVCETFTINNGATFDNSNDKLVDVKGDLIISNGTFNSGGSNTINVDGTLTLSGGTYNGETSGTDSFGALNISSGSFNTGSGGTITILGNLTYSGGSFTGGTGTSKIILNGSSSQTVTGNFHRLDDSEFHNLEVNNTNGVSFLDVVTINNQLTLTNGIITPSDSLVMNSAATISPAIGSSTAYINGKLSKVLASAGDDFIFPVGKSGLWGYAGVYNVTTPGLTWDVEYFATSAENEASVTNLTPTDDTYIKSVTSGEYWKIADNGSSNAAIKLSWNSKSGVSEQQTERETLEVMVWNNTTWDHYGGGTFSGSHTQTSGSFISTSAIAFSENIITLGTSDAANPLPIELISFTAKANTNRVELNWATASETNNDYFEVERSVDGMHFEVIAIVDGAGNSYTRLDYSETDYNPIYGISYYRIKQTDFDGQFSYTPTVSVLWNNNGNVSDDNIKVFPNPFIDGKLILQTKNINPGVGLNITIFDLNGKAIYMVNLVNPESQEINLIPMAIDYLKKGLYIINVKTKTSINRTKLIVE